MIMAYRGKRPVIGENVFIAPTATVIGDVTLERGASVWYGAVLRGDEAPIRVGAGTNIQDNCTIHTDPNKPVTIGANVTIGHNAVVHGCTVEDNSLIGIGAVVLNDARIRTGSVVAAGATVKEGAEIGPYHLVAGTPASLKKEMGEEIVELLKEPAKVYRALSREHAEAVEAGNE
jgi:carbonic anhydrase/acetyltransferase-like protein (isoleucine patch superfamily)